MSIAPKLVNEWNIMNLICFEFEVPCEIEHGMYSLVEEMPNSNWLWVENQN